MFKVGDLVKVKAGEGISAWGSMFNLDEYKIYKVVSVESNLCIKVKPSRNILVSQLRFELVDITSLTPLEKEIYEV